MPIPAATRGVEVDQPAQLVRDDQVRAGRMDRVVRVGRRVGPDVERQRDRAAQGLEHLLAAAVAEHDEPVRERRDVRRLGPGRGLGGRVGREDHERRSRPRRRSWWRAAPARRPGCPARTRRRAASPAPRRRRPRARRGPRPAQPGYWPPRPRSSTARPRPPRRRRARSGSRSPGTRRSPPPGPAGPPGYPAGRCRPGSRPGPSRAPPPGRAQAACSRPLSPAARQTACQYRLTFASSVAVRSASKVSIEQSSG